MTRAAEAQVRAFGVTQVGELAQASFLLGRGMQKTSTDELLGRARASRELHISLLRDRIALLLPLSSDVRARIADLRSQLSRLEHIAPRAGMFVDSRL